MFYNREKELARLQHKYRQDAAQLLIVYGRRRVGKTELLNRFARDKRHIYFLADLSTEKSQLAQFSESIRLFTDDAALVDNPFATWQALFAYVRNLAIDEQVIVIIDEYPYLQSSNPAMTSILQKAWDEQLQNSRIFLVLCGSYISFMEREVLAHQSPLYGRRTGQFWIKPLPFPESAQFFPEYSPLDKVRAFGMLGGIPAYLRQFDPLKSVEENLVEAFLYPDAFLNTEGRFLLMEELREPRNYFAILKAIALGNTRLNDIVQATGLARGMVGRYLETLQQLHILRREVPVTEKQPQKSRKGIYVFKDQYLRFWFRFIQPNQGLIESGKTDYVLRQCILPQLDQFLGNTFEAVCMDVLRSLDMSGKLPLVLDRMGRYWDKNTEIDILGWESERQVLLAGECKWRNKSVGMNTLDNLVAKTQPLAQQENSKSVIYALFSKSGFTEQLLALNRKNVLLFDLPALFRG